MQPVLDSLPDEWEKIVWANGADLIYNGRVYVGDGIPDLSVYGRYAAIEHASHDVIYVQDDDCIVSDPQAIVSEYVLRSNDRTFGIPPPLVVCNMPQDFRQFYTGADALVGFGACFHRDAPERAFEAFHSASFEGIIKTPSTDVFERTCDIVFTGLTPTVLVDVEKHDRDFASADDRMYRQPEHVAERQRMRELVARVRDA